MQLQTHTGSLTLSLWIKSSNNFYQYLLLYCTQHICCSLSPPYKTKAVINSHHKWKTGAQEKLPSLISPIKTAWEDLLCQFCIIQLSKPYIPLYPKGKKKVICHKSLFTKCHTSQSNTTRDLCTVIQSYNLLITFDNRDMHITQDADRNAISVSSAVSHYLPLL